MEKGVSVWSQCISTHLILRGETLWYFLAVISVFSLLGQEISRCSVLAADFEGFGDDGEEEEFSEPNVISDLPSRSSPPLTTTTKSDFETDRGPPPVPSDPKPNPDSNPKSIPMGSKPFEYWDEDEFEGLPVEETKEQITKPTSPDSSTVLLNKSIPKQKPKFPGSYAVEIVSVSFLIAFILNYFTGKRENERIALAWAAQFGTKDSIFDKNFSLLGTGDGKDTPLLLKEGQNVFKFYASGRRFCQGMLATMELQSRHDLIARIYNFFISCKDEIAFEVYMNDESMDHVIFALAKKKVAKTMQKEVKDLQRYANLLSVPTNRKWVVDELSVISESKEVAGDLITEAVLDQVFGEKAFQKFGKGFISLHFSDQHPDSQRKKLLFKFALPKVDDMATMSRLVALIPYYIDLVGRYKLSPQARSKTEAARTKASQEVYRELQNARQEELQRRKEERRKLADETEAKLSAEAIRKKEEKDRARQLKKTMPKVKMTRAR